MRNDLISDPLIEVILGFLPQAPCSKDIVLNSLDTFPKSPAVIAKLFGELLNRKLRVYSHAVPECFKINS
jgi:hypothetical protein